MDLQSLGDKAVTSGNACPPENLRAYSPQISDVSRCQPDTSGLARGGRTSVLVRVTLAHYLEAVGAGPALFGEGLVCGPRIAIRQRVGPVLATSRLIWGRRAGSSVQP